MTTDPNLILMGPEDNSGIPIESYGKLHFDKLKSFDPNKVKIVDVISGKQLTNGELLKKCIKLSVALENRLFLRKGDTISIITENNLWCPIVYLACFFSGIIINPLNYAYTIGEILRLTHLTKPKIIMCSENVLDITSQVSESLDTVEEVIVLNDNGGKGKRSITDLLEDLDVDFDSFKPRKLDAKNDTAAILCSTGTTGFPKGVMLTHENLRPSIVFIGDPTFGAATSEDRSLIVLPVFHIAGMHNLMLNIYFDCTLFLLKNFKPELFLSSIEKFQITHLSVVPSVVNLIANSELVLNYKIDSLKDIYCSGYHLSESTKEACEKRVGKQCIRQAYGATELSGGCIIQPRKFSETIGGIGLLTHGFSGKVCHLQTGKALKSNEMGEIRIKGPGVMKGYIGNTEETKASFDEEDFYKTGDVGFYDDQGVFYIVDRIKELIKYKGFQVSPAEVESILYCHPSVIEVVVVGIPNERMGELPTAFIVKKDDHPVTEKEICDFVAERVSVHKRLHGGVKFMQHLPKSPNGKILRKILKEMYN